MRRWNLANGTEWIGALCVWGLRLLRCGLAAGVFLAALSASSADRSLGIQERQAREQGGVSVSSSNELGDAKTLLESGRVVDAEHLVRGYLKTHNASAEGHFLLGTILFRKIQAEAVQSRVAPESAEAFSLDDSASSREINAKASLAEFTEGAKYAEPGAADLKIVAMDYVLLGSYADASKWLARSLERNPNDAEAWYYLGRSKYNENRFAEAIEAFSKCLVLEPRNIKAESNLGLAYAGLNRVPEAVAAFHAAIEWENDSPHKFAEPYIDLGDLLIQQSRADEAVVNLAEAVRIAPRDSRAREKLASAYLALKRPAEARNELEAAVAFDPKNASLHYLLASSYRQLGLTDKTAEELQKFEELKAQAKSKHAEPAKSSERDH